MFEDSMNTLDFVSKYIPLALPANTLPGWNNSLEIMNRKETPYKKLADILCKNLRRGGDEVSNMLAAGFVSLHKKNRLPLLSHHLVDSENVELFELYYIKQASKDEVMDAFGFEDERTLYKKLNRSRLLFASALYDFALFANK